MSGGYLTSEELETLDAAHTAREDGYPPTIATRHLTARESAALDAIRATRDRGYPPSVRELAGILGVTSTSSVAHVLDGLARKGCIRRGPGARSIEVLDAPPGDTDRDATARTIARLTAQNTAMRRELTARGLQHAIPREQP